MTPAQLASAVGFLAPLLVAFLNQAHWTTQVKQIVMVVAATILGVVTAAVYGKLDLHNLVITVPIVIALCQASYSLLWKPTGIAPAVEAATSTRVDLSGQGIVVDPSEDLSWADQPLP